MTPAQIKASIRAQAYETSAAFWSDEEIYAYMWQAECEVAALVECTETTDSTTTTVSGTVEYAKPTDCLIIKRLTWDSVKLKKITLSDLDAMDGTGYGGTVSTGNPEFYYEHGANVGLYPTPTSAKTLKFWHIKQPTELTAASTTFTVPQLFQHYIPDYCLYRMYLKDQDDRANTHLKLWDENIGKAISKWKHSQHRDQYSVVRCEENNQVTSIGIV